MLLRAWNRSLQKTAPGIFIIMKNSSSPNHLQVKRLGISSMSLQKSKKGKKKHTVPHVYIHWKSFQCTKITTGVRFRSQQIENICRAPNGLRSLWTKMQHRILLGGWTNPFEKYAQVKMGSASPNGCFRKWWYPQNTPKWSFLVGKPWLLGKPTILGNPQIEVK